MRRVAGGLVQASAAAGGSPAQRERRLARSRKTTQRGRRRRRVAHGAVRPARGYAPWRPGGARSGPPRAMRRLVAGTATLARSSTAAATRALARTQSGQSMVEYALVVALVAVVAMIAIRTFGAGIGQIFTDLLESIRAEVTRVE